MQPNYSPNTLENFIVFEGLDGAGTSTQSLLLEKNLSAAGMRAVLSSEPTAGPVGVLIRQMMRGRLRFSPERRETERMLAYLFAADRHDHLYNDVDGILAQIARGNVAISTRYYYSSYAYNASDPEDFDFIDRLNRDFPVPQIVVYLRVPLEVSLGRLEQRDVQEFYERRDELSRVSRNYERLFEPLGDRVIIADSTAPREEVAQRIFEEVKRRLVPGT